MSRRAIHPEPVSKMKPAIEHLPAISVVALTAMTVVPHLVPFDTSAAQWNNVAAIMLWLLLLLGWALAGVLNGKGIITLDRTTILVLALTLLPGVSAAALCWRGDGNARLAVNLAWQWAAFGIAFFLSRQWLKNAADVRMLAAVMVAICVGMSAFALVQFAWLMPQSRELYRADPNRVLIEAGLEAPEGSPQRKHFENRLASTEPTATFALTNSLAGLLTPWLVLVGALLGRAMPLRRWQETWRFVVLAAVLLVVLMLTKSRTAILATLAGFALALFYATPLARRIDWRLPLGLALFATLAVSGGIVSGALDAEVLSEAPKSVLYRFQYWQATAEMIRDYPLLGASPGNFQDTYKHYQLPEASENIGDPHNFVMEIWSTSGSLAFVVLMVLAGGLPWELRRAVKQDANVPDSSPPTAPLRAHAIGLLVGLMLAYACGFLSGMMPALEIFCTAAPAAALTLWLLRPWIERGTLTLPMLVAPLLALLINLLAAGGISFPGVATSLWLLVAMMLVVGGVPSCVPQRSHSFALGVLGLSVVATIVFHVTVYNPVFRSDAASSESLVAVRLGDIVSAIERAQSAAELDRLSPRPWLSLQPSTVGLADLWFARMMAEGDGKLLREEFDNACAQAIELDPRSESTYTRVGHFYLILYRRFGQRGDLLKARDHYAEAVTRYPNNALTHAQLAWVLHLCGEDQAASEQAELALELDNRHEHSEYKLKEQSLYDQSPATGLDQPEFDPAVRAEPLMQRLRKASTP